VALIAAMTTALLATVVAILIMKIKKIKVSSFTNIDLSVVFQDLNFISDYRDVLF